MRLSTAIICCFLLTSPVVSVADIIYFKDGMRTVCQGRVRIENDEVKCDYKGVVLSYRKIDIEHIHETVPTGETDEPPASAPVTELPAAAGVPELETPTAPAQVGTAFYDPRRRHKYWSSPTARHDTYEEAVNALAREFGRSPAWIEAHIGQTNDLEQIRRNMTRAAETASSAPPPSPSVEPVGEASFYDPRREYKFRISATRGFHTYREAIEALAQEYGAVPRWVEENMGSSNNISTIRENLERKKSEAAGP